jgi:hypothetical protein
MGSTDTMAWSETGGAVVYTSDAVSRMETGCGRE